MPFRIQQHVFLVNFYVLPVQGAELVLGVQWLQLLGPILLDYQALTMSFTWNGEKVFLQGEQAWQLTPVSLHHLRKL